MRLLLITCLSIAGLLCIEAGSGSERVQEKPEIVKLELVDLGEGVSDIDGEDSEETEVQRKRDSGYSYKRPESFAPGSGGRYRLGRIGDRGRIANRHPARINRPVAKYGPPGYRNPSPTSEASHGPHDRDKSRFHGHFYQQHSNKFDGRPSGLQEQEVPSPIRQSDFVEPNPISTQNNQPFATHSANYLPPENQKLPGYSATQSFSTTVDQAQTANFQDQNIVPPQGQISDAALFLSENARVIQQLYGASPNEQDFAPHTDQVHDLPGDRFENFEAGSQGPHTFPGSLPSYASGILGARETLEQIQSLEKDRLIVQLQRALATQTQAENTDVAGRYAEDQPSYVRNQDLPASLGQRTKIHGLNAQQSTPNFAIADTAFDRSPFLPGTLSYGLSTTARPSTIAPTTTTTTTTTTVQPPRPTKGDGTLQAGSPAPATGVPVYGGFVPTLITGTTLVSNVPSYGPSLFAPAPVTPVRPSGSSPTYFGLPIPTDHDRKPSSDAAPPSTASSTPSGVSAGGPSTPSSPAFDTLPIPVYPVVTPFKPVLPATPTHVHPPLQSTPSTPHPTYGVQTPVIHPFLYKPVKPVYPFYYYPNVAYQLHKPTLPTYPWNYAPAYAPAYAQAKPTQIWK